MGIKIALAGNPNSGKTTLFNALTGANQYVGNWPGVTVEKKEGKLKGNKEVVIQDLPGIYSLSPYTVEEVVSRNYLINNRPDAIINIVDGTNLERNLYLSTQIMELGIPVVMAVNMADLTEKNGDKIDLAKLSKAMGCPVFSISALKGTGIKEVTDKAIAVAKSGEANKVAHTFADEAEAIIAKAAAKLPGDIEEAQKRFFAIKLLEKDSRIGEVLQNAPDVSAEIKEMEEKFDDDTESIITNERYNYITSIIGSCLKKANKTKLTKSDKIDKIVTNRLLALPIFALIMFLVYYIAMSTVGAWATDWTNDNLFGDGFHLFGMSGKYDEAVEEWADENVFTDEVKAVIDAAAADKDIIGADELQGAFEDKDFEAFEEAYGSYRDEFYKGEEEDYAGVTVYDIDAALGTADEDGNGGALDEEGEFTAPDPADYGTWIPSIPVLVEKLLDALNVKSEFVRGLILDGIVAGVGAVLGFVPQMLVLFILLAILEECGYMARVAFIMDRIFRKFGLSGKSFIPILIGTGCGVPGVMASRTIENERDRRMTIMTTCFIPCGAKLPIIALITAALFNGSWWVAPSCYFMGMAVIIISGIILKKTKIFAGEPAPFVMELPAYHMPTFGSVMRSMWERGWSFIKKAGTIILLSSIVIWLGSVFGNDGSGFGFNPDLELEDSVLGSIGNAISWIFAPLGFDNIKATIATIMGLVAKEEVVGVFGVLDFEGMTSALAGYSFLAFNLLCTPCFAALGAIKREMNSRKWFWITVAYQLLTGYVVALMIYQIGRIFTAGAFGVGTVFAILCVIGILYLLFRPYKESQTLDIKIKTSKK